MAEVNPTIGVQGNATIEGPGAAVAPKLSVDLSNINAQFDEVTPTEEAADTEIVFNPPAQAAAQPQVAETTFKTATTAPKTAAPTAPTMKPATAETKRAEPLLSSKPAVRPAGVAGQTVEAAQAAETEGANEIKAPSRLTQRAPRREPVQAAQKAPTPRVDNIEPTTPEYDNPVPENYVKPLEETKTEVKAPSLGKRIISSMKRGKRAKEYQQSKVKREVENKSAIPTGNDVVTKLTASIDRSLGYEDVSLGSNVILTAIRQPGSILLDRVNKAASASNNRTMGAAEYLKDTWGIEDFTGTDAAVQAELLMMQINKMDVWVTLCKSPVSEPESYQSRRLRVHHGDGVRVNPLAVKAFNADFDGDGSQLHLSGKNIKFARRAIEYIINTDGKATIDAPLIFQVQDTEYLKDLFNSEFVSTTYRTTDIIDAYLEYCKTANMENMLRRFQEVAGDMQNRVRGDKNDALASIIDTLYNVVATLKRLEIEESLVTSDYVEDSTRNVGANVIDIEQAKGLTGADYVVTRIYEEAKAGKMPPNYPQFVAEYGTFLGDVDGKNNHFRIGANVANRIKRSAKTYIGQEGMYELWMDTVATAVSVAMNAKVATGEKKRYGSEWLKASVFAECGLPSKAASLEDWGIKFVRTYNRYVAFLNVANDSITTSFGIIEGNKIPSLRLDRKGDRFVPPTLDRAFVGAFIKIYGEFSLGALFGSNISYAPRDASLPMSQQYDSWEDSNNAYFVLSKYKDLTLEKFAHNNRAWVTPNVRKGHLMDSKLGWRSLLEACADSQRAAASSWYDSLVGTKGNAGLLGEWKSMLKNLQSWSQYSSDEAFRERGYNSFDAYLADVVDVLSSTQPGMFAYYEMDNPFGFAASDYGQQIYNGGDMISIRFAMVYEWRTSRLRELAKKVANADVDTYLSYVDKFRHEKHVLASSSDLWSMLMQEARTGNKTWKRYLKERSIPRKGLNGSRLPSDAGSLGFFDKYDTSKWPSVKSFVMDTSVPGDIKMAVLRDMTVADRGFVNTLAMEMPYQLECDPKSSYSGLNNPGFSSGAGNPIKAAKDDMVIINNKFSKMYQDRFSPVQKEDGTWDNSNVDRYDTIISDYRHDPMSFSYVPEEIYMGLVFADKESNDKEKAGQAAQTHAGYNAVVDMFDGGHTTELRTVDSQAMGRISWQDLTRRDLLDALSGRREIRFFDEYGEMCTLNEDTEINWARYPRLCGLIDYGRSDVSPDARGNIVSVRAKSTTAPDLLYRELMERPGFAALVSLFTPRHNKSTFNAEQAGHAVARQLISTIEWYATQCKNGNRIDLRMEPVIKELNARDADYKKWLADKPDSDWSQNLGDEVVKLIEEYASLVKVGRNTENSKCYLDELLFDVESIGSFGDTRQRVSGAKTSTATGKEGAETKRHQKFQGYLAFGGVKDGYRDSKDLSEEDQMRLEASNALTNIGEYYKAGMECIVYDPVFETNDPTMRDHGNQTNVLSRFFVSKRSNSGEAHSLKMRKSGLVGGDHIIKNRKYQREYDSWPEFEDALNKMFQEDLEAGMPGALAIEKVRWELAQWIEAVDNRMDYDNLMSHEYMEIARLTCVFGPEGNLVFRSLDQISTKLNTMLENKYDLDNIAAEEETIAEFIKDCQAIVDTVGFGTGQVDYHSYLLRIPSLGYNSGEVHTARRKWSSSFERNMQLLEKAGTVIPSETVKKLDQKNRKTIEDVWTNNLKKEYSQYEKEPDAAYDKRIREKARESLDRISEFNILGYNGSRKACSGSANAWVLENIGPSDAIAAIEEAHENLMTVLIAPKLLDNADVRAVYEKYADVSFKTDRFITIPFFDRELNGYGETQSSSFWLPRGVIEWTVEDADGRFPEADASMVATKHHGDNINIKDEGVYKIDIDKLFANTWERYDGYEFLGYRIAKPNEIASSEKTPNQVSFQSLDLGISEDNANFDKVFEKTKTMMDEFYSAWDGKSRFIQDSTPDHIIGFAVCGFRDPYTEEVIKVYAPIIPFVNNMDSNRPAPAEFKCMPKYNNETGTIDVYYVNTSSMVERFVKKHEGENGANKFVMFGEFVDDFQFANGVHIDTFVWDESTSGRLVGDNKRLATMVNLLFEMYEEESNFAYNLALNEESFPGQDIEAQPDSLKAKLATGIVPMEDWFDLPNGYKFHVDPEVNAFINVVVKQCLRRGVNPSFLLANQYMTQDGLLRNRMVFEWKTVMETSFDWEDAYLKFMHTMCPDLCPYGIYGDAEGCLYKVETNDTEFGVLKKWVPYSSGNNKGTWCVVRAHYGMAGEDNSATKMPGFTGEIELQSIVENSHGGNWVPGTRLSYLKNAFIDSAPRKLLATTQDVLEYKIERTGDPIDSFRGDYDFLSNFYPAPVTVGGVTYRNAEAAFQAQKDPSRAAEFANLEGKEAKKLGGQVNLDTASWNNGGRDEAMRKVLEAKFSQNKDLASRLVETQGRPLIEGNTWGDTYWGVSKGIGENKLGQLLMDIRDNML